MALCVALLQGGVANAQSNTAATPATPASAEEPTPATTASAEESKDIVVTGSRIQRAGFDAPTPTTVIGAIELRQGDRPNLGEVLNDLPQFRATSTPQTTTGNLNNSATTADLRGLGSIRTLTLLDGHRFTGSNDLAIVPQALVKRVDVVTGGASAAYGSGAVAGVVNIILNDDLKGLTVGANTGISSRGDTAKHGIDATYGTKFAGDRGHFMIAAEWLKEDGAFGRESRPNLDSAIFGRANGQLVLANNVNYTILNSAGSVLSTAARPYNLSFSPDGRSVIPLPLGSETNGQFTVGGTGNSLYDYVAVTSPYDRINVYGRASYDVTGDMKFWVDGSFSRVHSNFPLFPETPTSTISADNAYLTPDIKTSLAAAGVTYPFLLGKILTNVGTNNYASYSSTRRNLEGSAGIDGKVGKFKYNLYYDHGELRNAQSLYNQRITANYNRAIDAVVGAGGTPVCRVNAVTVTDAACSPINLFGNVPVSAAALAYAFGSGSVTTTTKLDAVGGSISGSLFSLPAGSVDIAVGGDFRWEKLTTDYLDPISVARGFGTLNSSILNGGFSVKEGFGEINVPVFDIPQAVHFELNGAARYSDYSTAGGIWSWKGGGTLRVVNDLLLRGTYSRDIRSPVIAELFTTTSTNIGNVNDPFNRTGGNPTPQANTISYSGGNPGLVPETARTLTLGSSYSPHFIRGLRLSVDYYKIDIKNVIATLSAQDTLSNCYTRNPNDPTCGGLISRTAATPANPTGPIAFITRTFQNLASYETSGVDVEISYVMPARNIVPSLGGSLRFRGLANYTPHLYINTGIAVVDRAGDVGNSAGFTTPHWRGTGSVSYQSDVVGIDLRLRYVGGGKFDHAQAIVNNDVAARAYVDLGLQLNVAKRITIFGTINNLFDRDPPYVTYASANYDMIGRYFSGGVKVNF